MKNLDHQARGNVLRKLIHLMSGKMATHAPSKTLHVEIKHGLGEQEGHSHQEEDDECPHCDGEGCRFCK